MTIDFPFCQEQRRRAKCQSEGGPALIKIRGGGQGGKTRSVLYCACPGVVLDIRERQTYPLRSTLSSEAP